MTAQNRPARISGAVVCRRGQVRPNNEDNYLLSGRIHPMNAEKSGFSIPEDPPLWRLYAVFDGMGGGEGGEEAAAAAAETFAACQEDLSRAQSREEADRIVRKAFLDANRQILTLRKTRRVLGTTAVALCTDGRAYKLYHLGDSRGYLMRWGELFPLTEDHTLARFKQAAGLPGEPVFREERDRHILTRYIGCDPTGEHLRPEEGDWDALLPGDRLLLCSDGLWDACSHRELCRCLRRETPPQEQAEELSDLADRQGGEDNITCLIVHIS